MDISIRSIIKGFLSYTPLLPLIVRKGTGGTDSARYCYSVWLRHLVLLHAYGMKNHPKVVGELGPGDSLGIGLSSLITGAQQYYALDLIEHANFKKNLQILEELESLFRNSTPIPDEEEFPDIKPRLKNYEFPKHLFSNAFNETDRFQRIKNALMEKNRDDDIKIRYVVPWDAESIIERGTVDLIMSQAVMEHVLDLEKAYLAMYSWLKEGGFISHQIEYKAHETHKIWNGHWKFRDTMWKIIMHGRSYPINRKQHSSHMEYIVNAGFKIKNTLTVTRNDGYVREQLSLKYRALSNEDLSTSSAHIIAVK